MGRSLGSFITATRGQPLRITSPLWPFRWRRYSERKTSKPNGNNKHFLKRLQSEWEFPRKYVSLWQRPHVTQRDSPSKRLISNERSEEYHFETNVKVSRDSRVLELLISIVFVYTRGDRCVTFPRSNIDSECHIAYQCYIRVTYISAKRNARIMYRRRNTRQPANSSFLDSFQMLYVWRNGMPFVALVDALLGLFPSKKKGERAHFSVAHCPYRFLFDRLSHPLFHTWQKDKGKRFHELIDFP